MKETTNNPLIIVHKLPHKILAYVKKHYPDGTIFDMIEDYNVHGEFKYYDVDVVDADNTYHLRFDKAGKLAHEEIEIDKIDAGERNPNMPEEKDPSPTDEMLDEF
jgi:hypothetical protein